MKLNRINKVKEIVQLDFEHDNKLFIDPYKINKSQEECILRGKEKIIKYFEIFFDAVENNDKRKVIEIGRHLHEINATKLGYTDKNKKPKGKGFSLKDLITIYEEAIKIKDYIEDMPDILVLANNVGPDKVSDLTTNIMYTEILEYTQNIISKYSIEVSLEERKKWIFDIGAEKWLEKNILVPCIDDEEILFLPKDIVSNYEIFSYQNMYWQLIYPFYKMHTSMHGLIRILKSGEKKPDCKKIKTKYPLNRITVKDFVVNNRSEYKRYKEALINNYWKK